MSARHTRRAVLKAAAAAGAAWYTSACSQTRRPPSDKLNLAVIGTGNRGYYNLGELASENCPVNIVALCDVDDNYLATAVKFFPGVKTYSDYRVMLGQRDIDAVLVATPDHVHAWATLAALRAGKHVYCEKPLAHSIEEARLVTDTARQLKLVTQLGTQIHAGEHYRRVVELVRSGAIGNVGEVHVFVDTNWSTTQPPHPGTPPPNLHFDLWLGPVPPRPYSPDYLPAVWRRWWAFGEGTLGDMGCHYMDLPKWALEMGTPVRIQAEGPPVHPEFCPAWTIVHYEFAARAQRPPVKLTWYDGGKRPDDLLEELKLTHWHHGVLFVGQNGYLIADYERHKLLPEEKFKDFVPPPPSIPPSPGHHREWVQACLDNNPVAPQCNFAYGGPLTETILLGCVAYRAGKLIEWDTAKMSATNAPEAEQFIRLRYREGWRL